MECTSILPSSQRVYMQQHQQGMETAAHNFRSVLGCFATGGGRYLSLKQRQKRRQKRLCQARQQAVKTLKLSREHWSSAGKSAQLLG